MLDGIDVVVKGYSHIKEGTECQDSAAIFNSTELPYVIGVVADGHGSKSHFRSKLGSKFATEAAVEAIHEFMSDYNRFVEAYQRDKDYLIDRIVKMVIVKWHKKIKKELDDNPITEEERIKYLDETKSWTSIYGTTLLVSVMSDRCSFGFLVGDGSFVVVDQSGKAYIPIEDLNSKANFTSSLSSSNISCNKVSFDEMPFLVLLSTDGLVKSFDNTEDFLDFNQTMAREIVNLSEKNDQEYIASKMSLQDRLIKIFDKRSREGSEDDISLAAIFNTELSFSTKGGLETRLKINKATELIKQSEKEISRLKFKRQQLQGEKANIRDVTIENNKQIAKERQRIKDLEQAKDMLEKELDEILKRQAEIEEKKKQIFLEIEQIEKSCKEKEDKNKQQEELYNKKEVENQKIEYEIRLEEQKINDKENEIALLNKSLKN